MNPQAWNRYSYVYNNPLKYNDPSGHIACNFAHLPDEGHCDGEEWIPELEGHFSLGDQSNYITLPIALHLVQLPSEISASIDNGAGDGLKRLGLDPESVAIGLSTVSAGLDILEGYAVGATMAGIPVPLAIPIVLAATDAGVTGFNCYLAGECYVGQPHPDLPAMLVVNQDVLISSADLALGGYLPEGVDIVTTFANYTYDVFDVTGGIPNMVSLGIGVDTEQGQIDIFLLFYKGG